MAHNHLQDIFDKICAEKRMQEWVEDAASVVHNALVDGRAPGAEVSQLNVRYYALCDALGQIESGATSAATKAKVRAWVQRSYPLTALRNPQRLAEFMRALL